MDSWSNTITALQSFGSILVCQKCGLKPMSPIRFTNCEHFFCQKCANSTTMCYICKISVQPKDMSHNHIVSNLIRCCDTIAEVVNMKNLWDVNIDPSNTLMNTSMNTTVSKTICTPKNIHIPKRNINKPNYKGETQLHTACLKKNIEHVKILLMAGADPNTKDNAGWTPLQEIVNYGHTELCEILLKGGAFPNTPGDENRRPLHDAVIYNRIEEAKLLLQYHADKDVYDKYGKSPLDYCRPEMNEMRRILMGSQKSPLLSEKSSELNHTLDRSFIVGQDKLVVLASNLKPENQKILNLVAAQHKFKVVTTDRSSVTHVIVEANRQNITKLTVDVMFTIVRGNWLLNSEWIALAGDMEDVSTMDLELFEISGAPILGVPRNARLNAECQKPRLFNNCFFHFALQANKEYRIDGLRLTKNDLVKLVKEGEGTVLIREPKPEDLNDASQMIPFHTADDSSHPLHRCTHYVIYIPGKGEPLIKYMMPHIKSLPLIWLIECIEKFTLVDPAFLGLS
ncbi:BRCA1-associated RING domain protein 1 isoform X1 [Harpegnathos saltator]|nr:BRCA1-associated RING domain protein 1 isoform X1 [Harpegnathos saltator]